MLPIIGTLLTEGITWIAKGLMTAGKQKITEFVKEKTGIDLNTSELKPEDIAKLKQLEMQHQHELKKLYFDAIKAELEHEQVMGQQDVDIIKTVNQTMMQEAMAEDKWQRRWRPLWGYLTALSFNIGLLTLVIGAIIAAFTHNAEQFEIAMRNVKDVLTEPMLWAVPLSIIGVTAYGRTKEKVKRLEALTGVTSPGVLDKLLANKK